MDQSDIRKNYRLGREVLTLARNVSRANPGTSLQDYILRADDLQTVEISVQNEMLTEQLCFLQDMLQPIKEMPPRDTIGTPPPPPSALRPPVFAAPAAGQQRGREDAGWKTECEAKPRGRGRLILNGEGLDDTTQLTLDGNGKIQPRDVVRYCRRAAVEWIQSKAEDISFQPTGEQDLVPDVCRHLIDTIPVSNLQKHNAYTQPGRFVQAVLTREALW